MIMTHRERVLAVLNYQEYDRLPLVHFGFWEETLEKWATEGHISTEAASGWKDGNQWDREVSAKLGFDFNWVSCVYPSDSADNGLLPPFEESVVGERPDGTRLVRNADGVVVLQKPGVRSIPSEVDHLLKDRGSWEAHYLPRLQYSPSRIDLAALRALQLDAEEEGLPLGIYCGSMIGRIREWCGLVGLSYLIADDEGLLDEMVGTYADLCLRVTEQILATGIRFDFGHFWEDIAFKNGPLVNPVLFEKKLLGHYERVVRLLNSCGVGIVSVDCDGRIDKLVPTWLRAGVNTMFPIEVGTWGASILPWRQHYGRQVRGVGGMDKRVLAHDRRAIDAEVERLRSLVALGGYIPCPDHRLAPDSVWENVQYYCDRMRGAFG
jgi:uroporphyrinogen decarboxylase